MAKERVGKDRRVIKDRRTGRDSSYTGPEKRGVWYRKLQADRRKKK